MSGHDRGWLHRQTVALDMQRKLNESYPSFPDSLGKGATVSLTLALSLSRRCIGAKLHVCRLLWLTEESDHSPLPFVGACRPHLS